MQIYYLAQTAIIDLSTSVREYASLQKSGTTHLSSWRFKNEHIAT